MAAAASANKELERLKNEIRAFCVSAGRNFLSISDLVRDFRDMSGEDVEQTSRSLGFMNFDSLLRSINGEIVLLYNDPATGVLRMKAVSSDATRHIEQLVARQKFVRKTAASRFDTKAQSRGSARGRGASRGRARGGVGAAARGARGGIAPYRPPAISRGGYGGIYRPTPTLQRQVSQPLARDVIVERVRQVLLRGNPEGTSTTEFDTVYMGLYGSYSPLSDFGCDLLQLFDRIAEFAPHEFECLYGGRFLRLKDGQHPTPQRVLSVEVGLDGRRAVFRSSLEQEYEEEEGRYNEHDIRWTPEPEEERASSAAKLQPVQEPVRRQLEQQPMAAGADDYRCSRADQSERATVREERNYSVRAEGSDTAGTSSEYSGVQLTRAPSPRTQLRMTKLRMTPKLARRIRLLGASLAYSEPDAGVDDDADMLVEDGTTFLAALEIPPASLERIRRAKANITAVSRCALAYVAARAAPMEWLLATRFVEQYSKLTGHSLGTMREFNCATIQQLFELLNGDILDVEIREEPNPLHREKMLKQMYVRATVRLLRAFDAYMRSGSGVEPEAANAEMTFLEMAQTIMQEVPHGIIPVQYLIVALRAKLAPDVFEGFVLTGGDVGFVRRLYAQPGCFRLVPTVPPKVVLPARYQEAVNLLEAELDECEMRKIEEVADLCESMRAQQAMKLDELKRLVLTTRGDGGKQTEEVVISQFGGLRFPGVASEVLAGGAGDEAVHGLVRRYRNELQLVARENEGYFVRPLERPHPVAPAAVGPRAESRIPPDAAKISDPISWQTPGARTNDELAVVTQETAGAYVSITVTYVNTPSDFYFQHHAASSSNLKALQVTRVLLDACYARSNEYCVHESSVLTRGLPVAVYDEAGCWERALVVREPRRMEGGEFVEVFVVDTGARNGARVEDVRFLPAKYLKVPFQAMHAKLAFVRPFTNPTGASTWTPAVTHELIRLLNASGGICQSQAHWITGTFAEVDPETRLSRGQVTLELIDVSQGDELDVEISNELITGGFALPVDDEPSIFARLQPGYHVRLPAARGPNPGLFADVRKEEGGFGEKEDQLDDEVAEVGGEYNVSGGDVEYDESLLREFDTELDGGAARVQNGYAPPSAQEQAGAPLHDEWSTIDTRAISDAATIGVDLHSLRFDEDLFTEIVEGLEMETLKEEDVARAVGALFDERRAKIDQITRVGRRATEQESEMLTVMSEKLGVMRRVIAGDGGR